MRREEKRLGILSRAKSVRRGLVVDWWYLHKQRQSQIVIIWDYLLTNNQSNMLLHLVGLLLCMLLYSTILTRCSLQE